MHRICSQRKNGTYFLRMEQRTHGNKITMMKMERHALAESGECVGPVLSHVSLSYDKTFCPQTIERGIGFGTPLQSQSKSDTIAKDAKKIRDSFIFNEPELLLDSGDDVSCKCHPETERQGQAIEDAD